MAGQTTHLVLERYPGIDGFLGTRASLMLDVVVVILLVILPALGISIYLVKRGAFRMHKMMQIALGLTLLVVVVMFEIDVNWISDWERRAAESPLYDPARKWTCWAGCCLIVHLVFAIPTALLWAFVVIQALRHFPREPRPGPYSARHRIWARLVVGTTVMTAVTGWSFYWLAFVLS